MKQIKCKKCDKSVHPKHGRSLKVQVILVIFGFLTLGVGWLVLMIYDIAKPKYSCPKCGKKMKI